jgi:hypothetical protein
MSEKWKQKSCEFDTTNDGIPTPFIYLKTNHLSFNPIVDRVDHWIFFLWEFWIIFIQYVLDDFL